MKMIKIEIRTGDIAQTDCEAVVNAANNHFWMGSGVAGALKRAGGDQIEAEATARGPVSVGEAIVTGGGKLKARYVIHAAVMGQDLQTDAAKIALSTRNSLRRAAELGVHSVAFPALGTGVGGFSMEDCARIMIGEVLHFNSEKSSLEKVVFVLFNPQAAEVFEHALEKVHQK